MPNKHYELASPLLLHLGLEQQHELELAHKLLAEARGYAQFAFWMVANEVHPNGLVAMRCDWRAIQPEGTRTAGITWIDDTRRPYPEPTIELLGGVAMQLPSIHRAA